MTGGVPDSMPQPSYESSEPESATCKSPLNCQYLDMTSEASRFTARDLGTLCGVSERTVRYYVAEGLLPPPLNRGRGANFTEDHLTRLRLIRTMQEAGTDLEAIRDYLAELERELTQTGASFEAALAVWRGRAEQTAWRDHFRKVWTAPEPLHRYRIGEGIELLVDSRAAISPNKMRELLQLIRENFEADD